MGGTSKKDCDGWLIRELVWCWILNLILHTGKINFKGSFL